MDENSLYNVPKSRKLRRTLLRMLARNNKELLGLANSGLSAMMRVTVQVTNLSGERYWGYESQLPGQVQIAVNINVLGLEQKGELLAEAPFVFTVNYSPSIAQLSVKGRARVDAEKSEISKMIDDHKQNKAPPTPVIQAVSSIAMAEAILLSKSLGIPPPLPPIGGLPEQQTQVGPKKQEPRYTT